MTMFTRLLVLTGLCALLFAAPARADVTAPTATPTPTPTATPTAAPAPRPIEMRKRPQVLGTARYGKTLKRTVGRFAVSGATYRTRWLRDGKPIKGRKATLRRYQIRVGDVGHRIRVRITVSKPGHRTTVRISKPRRIKHVRDVRHTVKYSVETRGDISADVAVFKRQVQATLDDPRGWRAAGIAFRRVSSGGSMTVVLSQASLVPTFSSGCSSMWSCRVGRYVVINQERWKHASPAWNAASGTTLRGYRHMVVNHEVGHWLGWGHTRCGGKDKPAPIMMQQSKGRDGCSFNSWPLPSERNVPRYR